MALTGVHITFSYTQDGQFYKSGSPLPYGAQSSQTMASATTSTVSAPAAQALGQKPLLSISASAAIFYATGSAPDASGSTYPRRYYDPANGREDIFVEPGDKFAWTFA